MASSLMFAAACSSGGDLGSASNGIVDEPICGESVAPLLKLGQYPIGSVIASNSATHLLVTVELDAFTNFNATDIFLFAATGDLPCAEDGTPDLSSFTGESVPPGTTSKQFSIPLADLFSGDPVGQSLNLAVVVRGVRPDDPTVYDVWAYGDDAASCSMGGQFYPYEVCGEPEEESGCTRTQGYWKNHNECAEQRGLRRDWPESIEEKGVLCDGESRTNLELLQTPPAGGDAYLILAHQLLAAQLNIASGASSPDQVDDAIAEGLSLIHENCGDFVHADTELGQRMVFLASVLDAYNNGLTGPGHCK